MTPVLRLLFFGFLPDAPISVGAFFFEISIAAVKGLCYNDFATQFHTSFFLSQLGLHFYFGKNANPILAYPVGTAGIVWQQSGLAFFGAQLRLRTFLLPGKQKIRLQPRAGYVIITLPNKLDNETAPGLSDFRIG